MKIYRTPKETYTYLMFIGSIGMIFGLTIFLFVLSKYNQMVKPREVLLFLMFETMMLAGLIVAFDMLISSWRCNYFIELADESIIGKNLYSKISELLYGDIISISKSKFAGKIVIKTEKEKMLIYPVIENYEDFITAIKGKVPSLKEIDLN